MSHQISFALTPANSAPATSERFGSRLPEAALVSRHPGSHAMPRPLQPTDLTGLIIGQLGQLKASLGGQVTFELEFEPDLPPVAIEAAAVGELLTQAAHALAESTANQAIVLRIGLSVRDFDARALTGNRTQRTLAPGRYVVVHLASRTEAGDPPAGGTRVPNLAHVLPSLERQGAGLLLAQTPGNSRAVRMIFPTFTPSESTRPDSTVAGAPECRRVLLADDDEAVRLIAARVLQMLKFEVTVATDGEEALRVFEASKEPFRAVMLDISMPNLDGISAAIEIRKLSPTQAIVFISGDAAEDVTSRLPAGLAARVIQKPFSAAGIKLTLERCVPNQ